jgi:organic radical activating enzyme
MDYIMDYPKFKKDMLDTKSESFCAAKWYNATIWLGSGMTTSCHHPLPHKVDPIAVQSNPKLLHNTPEKKEQRRQMQCGERPDGCEYCWKIEDMGPGYISDRVYKSQIYTDQELQTAFTEDQETDVDLITLEISFDRTCNFACSYCNPAFSTTWVKDLKNNGGYTDLVSDGRNHFTHSHDSNQLFGLNEYNPYVEAFFKWWDSDLHSTLRELRITGGEPIMSPELWKLLDWFKKEDNTSDCSIVINSNLGGKPELIDRLVEARTHLPSLDVYTSCESTGVKAEYIRDGLDFNYWWDNLVRLHEAGIDTHCMMTINALCLHTLPALISKILAKRTELNTNRFAIMSLNILRFPSFQSALVLPRDIKISCSNQLKELINQDMHEFERGQIKRLIEYLQVINTPHNEAFEMPKLHNDFKQFYQQYDVRRNKNFETTFPELKDWYTTL